MHLVPKRFCQLQGEEILSGDKNSHMKSQTSKKKKKSRAGVSHNDLGDGIFISSEKLSASGVKESYQDRDFTKET